MGRYQWVSRSYHWKGITICCICGYIKNTNIKPYSINKCSAFSVLCPGCPVGCVQRPSVKRCFPPARDLWRVLWASTGFCGPSPWPVDEAHTEGLPPPCVASVQRPGLWVLLRPVCFYLWPCSMMGCRKHTEEGPPVAVVLPCFPVICQRASVPSCVKAPALACPGCPMLSVMSS